MAKDRARIDKSRLSAACPFQFQAGPSKRERPGEANHANSGPPPQSQHQKVLPPCGQDQNEEAPRDPGKRFGHRENRLQRKIPKIQPANLEKFSGSNLSGT